MKRQCTILSLCLMSSGMFALTDTEAQKKGYEILQALVNGHNRAFGHDKLLKASLDLSVWNAAMTEMKKFVTTIIDEQARAFGYFRDSTLVDALDKVTKAEFDLVNTIKISQRAVSSPMDIRKQIEAFTTISNNMITVQGTLPMNTYSITKNEAQKLLKNCALFIETTALKAKKELDTPEFREHERTEAVLNKIF